MYLMNSHWFAMRVVVIRKLVADSLVGIVADGGSLQCCSDNDERDPLLGHMTSIDWVMTTHCLASSLHKEQSPR